MLYLVIKAAISGVLVAAVSEIARRYPGWGGLIASLPLTSLLAMIWLYRDSGDPERVADLSVSTFWFFLPSVPLFIALPPAPVRATAVSGRAWWCVSPGRSRSMPLCSGLRRDWEFGCEERVVLLSGGLDSMVCAGTCARAEDFRSLR